MTTSKIKAMRCKFNCTLFILTLFLLSCTINKHSQQGLSNTGLYKVIIMYPNVQENRFDMDYYEKTHMPMVAKLLGDNLIYYEIDKGESGRTQNDVLPYIAIGYFCVKDIAKYNNVIKNNRTIIINDIANYTNIQPVIQINRVVKVEYQ